MAFLGAIQGCRLRCLQGPGEDNVFNHLGVLGSCGFTNGMEPFFADPATVLSVFTHHQWTVN